MSTRFQIAALVFMMTNAVAFGIGIVPILMIPAFANHAFEAIPAVVLGQQDQGGKHGGQAGMPKPEQSPPSLKTEIPGRDRKGEVVGEHKPKQDGRRAEEASVTLPQENSRYVNSPATACAETKQCSTRPLKSSWNSRAARP